MTVIGDHDPILMAGGIGGLWVECECGWISPSTYSRESARACHALHVAQVTR